MDGRWHDARPRRALVAGAFLAGLAIGLRSQTLVLTAPLLAFAWLMPRSGLTLRARLVALAAAAIGVALWAVPLVVASGGLSRLPDRARQPGG